MILNDMCLKWTECLVESLEIYFLNMMKILVGLGGGGLTILIMMMTLFQDLHHITYLEDSMQHHHRPPLLLPQGAVGPGHKLVIRKVCSSGEFFMSTDVFL